MKEESDKNEEQELIERLRKGDNKAVKKLYEKGFPAVRYFITKNQGDEDEAAEMYQQAFIVLYERLQGEDFSLQSTAGTFLFAVARNLWLATLKERRRYVSGYDNDMDLLEKEADPELSEILEKERAYEMMETSMDLLGEPCRTILRSFYHEKLSMDEIAGNMGYTNADNAKNQKYKCIVRLRRIFEDKMKMYRSNDKTEEL